MKLNNLLLILITYWLSGLFGMSYAQVKITDGADLTMDPNSLLELESTNRGLLLPRISLNSLDQPDPLTAPVPVGMFVYSSGGIVTDGFYYWNGSGWINFAASGTLSETLFTKSATATLLKTETFVLASGNITLTLPSVTSADNGLAITIKNTGSYVDLITVEGNADATIDGFVNTTLTRWCADTYIAWNGNWITKNRNTGKDSRIVVSETGSFTSIAEAVEFLSTHMTGPTVVTVASKVNLVLESLVIQLPYPVTFEGVSNGAVTVGPGPDMTGKPIFSCITDCSFKMLSFKGSTMSGYGSSIGEDAIHLTENGTSYNIKDCSFDGFYCAIVNQANAELWLFDCDIMNSAASGLLLDSPTPGVVVKVSETDFTGNNIGVNLLSGFQYDSHIKFRILFQSGSYRYRDSLQSIHLFFFKSYHYRQFLEFYGTGISGFDFSRPDGRDADAFIENNAGIEDDKAHCKINVVNNSLTTSCVVSNTWYKANWINTSSVTSSLLINNNMITYLPVKPRDLYLIISGDLTVDSNNRVITIGIVKNGVTTTRYGETALRITTANQPYQFSTVIYLENVAKDDYFELYCSTTTGSDVLKFQDVNWFVSAQ